MISEVDMKRHGKKWDQELTNAIQHLSQASGCLSKYLRSRKEKGTYGTEEV
jgi:hypothetical protein